jgi:hypothetical protein
MSWSNRIRHWLLALALAGGVLPARAADLDTLLPDDTTFVVSVNVKQVLESPLFTKHHQKQVEELLKKDVVQNILKDTGFDPLKDLDRVMFVMCQSSFQEEGTREVPKDKAGSAGEGPVILIQGRFDAAKIQARVKQAAKDFPDHLKVHGIGKANVAEITGPFDKLFAAVVDDHTIAATPRRDQMEDLLEKANGTRTTEYKNPEMAKLLKAWDPKQTIQVAATADMILDSSTSIRNDGMKRVIMVSHHRLRDHGIESLLGGGTVTDSIQAKATLGTKDPETAKKLQEKMDQGLSQIKAEGEQALAKQPSDKERITAAVDVLKTVQIKAEDKAVTVEGRASGEGVGSFVWSIFSASPAAPPPRAVEKSEKNVDK